MAILTPRWRLRAVAAALLSLLQALVSPLDAQRSVEYEVKAGYIVNFIQFVEWPQAAWPSADTPFRICVVGHDPFGDALDRAVKDERVNGRPIVVERQTALGALSRCQVVFAAGREDSHARDLIKAIDSSSVLTVGESSVFLEAGGAIAFAIDGGHVRFDINLRAAHIKDLHVSSKLLRVARSTWRGADGH